MNKFSISALALATALAMTPAALADSITFAFVPVNVGATTVTATNTSISTVAGTDTITISDADSAITKTITGVVTISSIAIDTGAGGEYDVNGTHAMYAYYAGGAGIEITSASCVGGPDPGVCLIGTENTGGYSASNQGQADGSFGGGFTLTYVSPYITSLFPGDQYTSPAELALLNAAGAANDTYGTSSNAFQNMGHTSVKGNVYGGTIDDLTVLGGSNVPEPSSLMLLGTGLLGLAGMLHRKLRA